MFYKEKTAKCPECGGNYVEETGYCLACKKKVGGKKDKKESIFTVKEDVQIGDVILEKGDKFKILEK